MVTALHSAASRGHATVCRALLFHSIHSHDGVDINSKTCFEGKDGVTAHDVARGGATAVFEEMLGARAINTRARDSEDDGSKMVHLALAHAGIFISDYALAFVGIGHVLAFVWSPCRYCTFDVQ